MLDEKLRSLQGESSQKFASEAISALEVLADKVSSTDFPAERSNAVAMALIVRKVSEYLAENVSPSDILTKADLKKEAATLHLNMQKASFLLLIACLKHGPTSGHLEIIQDLIIGTHIDTCGFIRGLDPTCKELQTLIVALKQNYTPKDFERSSSRYRVTASTVLKSILNLICGSEQVVNVRRKELMELYFHCLHRSSLTQEDNARVHQDLLELMHKNFSPNERNPTECFIFSQCKSGAELSGYLEKLLDHTKQKDFPLHTVAVETATSCLKCFFVVYRNKNAQVPLLSAVKAVSLCCIFKKGPMVEMAQKLSCEFQHFCRDSILNQRQQLLQTIQKETEMVLMDRVSGVDDLAKTINNLFLHLAFTGWIDERDSSYIVMALPWMIRYPHKNMIKLCLKVLKTKGPLINWRTELSPAKHMVQAFSEVIVGEHLNWENTWRETIDVRDMVQLFLGQVKNSRVLESLNPLLLELVDHALDNPTLAGATILPKFEEFINYKLELPKPECSSCDVCKKHLENLMSMVEKCCNLLENTGSTQSVPGFSMAVFNILQCIVSQIGETPYAHEISFHVNRMFQMLFEGPYQKSNGAPEIKVLLASPALVFVNTNSLNPVAIKDLVPSILRLCSCQCEQVRDLVSQIGVMALKESPEVLRGHLDKLISTLQEEGHMGLINCIGSMYEANVDREAIHDRLAVLIGYMQDTNVENQTAMLLFLTQVAKISGRNITPEQLFALEKFLVRPELVELSCELFRNLAESNPQLLAHCKKLLYSLSAIDAKFIVIVGMILTQIAITVESIREETIDYLLTGCQSCDVKDRTIYVGRLRALVVVDKDLLVKHREVFSSLKEDPNLTADCVFILEVIGGRDVDELNAEISMKAARLRSLSELVKKAELKSASQTEIVSYAPSWSRAVSDLLNPHSAADWRILAQNLGYELTEIHAWLKHPDPCMSVLIEWYTTNSSEAATQGVLNSLKKMRRDDVLAIIESNRPPTDANVRDELLSNDAPVPATGDLPEEVLGNLPKNMPLDDDPSPAIFLSYDVGDQEKVEQLEQQLLIAGYDCWMDADQQVEGERRMRRVDMGMDDAKVVICCVTEKYAGCEHGSKEIKLALSLGKPIIPLLLEATTLPSDGSVGSLLSGYQCVKFFEETHEAGSNVVYWPQENMKELLMQISCYVAPAMDAISGDYKGWWLSPENMNENNNSKEIAVQKC